MFELGISEIVILVPVLSVPIIVLVFWIWALVDIKGKSRR